MSENQSYVKLLDNTSNPGPLGLLGFGMTTLLLNLHNAGFYDNNAMIVGMGIFLGGIMQIIAGTQEWKKNNLFGATAFTSYGFFWLSLVAIWIMPKIVIAGTPIIAAPDHNAMGSYLLVWGIYSLAMFIGTLKHNKATQVLFGTLVILFFLLAIEKYTENLTFQTIAGWDGIFCGSLAIYIAVATVVNHEFGKQVLPLK